MPLGLPFWAMIAGPYHQAGRGEGDDLQAVGCLMDVGCATISMRLEIITE